MTRNKDNNYLIDREMQRAVNYSGMPTNRVQDAAVTESMGTIVDRSDEHLGTSDTAIIFMRRLLMRLAEQVADGIEIEAPGKAEAYRVLPIDIISSEAELAPLWRTHENELRARWAGTVPSGG